MISVFSLLRTKCDFGKAIEFSGLHLSPFMWKKSFLPCSIADLVNNKLIENFTNLCVSNVKNSLGTVFVSSLIKSVVT